MSDDDSEFDDKPGPFPEAPTLETYAMLYRQLLAAYRRRCAVTGLSGDRGGLEVVAIVPREIGGALHVSNYLVLCSRAATAFSHGHFIIQHDYTITTDASSIDASLLSDIKAERLLLPEDRLYWPDPAGLEAHRRAILSR